MSSQQILDDLLLQAGLPDAVVVEPITGRGFDNKIYRVELADGRVAVLRCYPTPREPEAGRYAFLKKHDVPAPKLLASSPHADLCEFVPGVLLGDLIETGRDTERVWQLVGEAFRRVHDVRFPSGLLGEVQAGQLLMSFHDPVARMHRLIDEATAGLRERAPHIFDHLPALYSLIDCAADALRAAPSALGHGDINMWNILVSEREGRATLIDWDYCVVRPPATEVSLLDKHASLFNGHGLPPAFFMGYGQQRVEPNTSLQRLIESLNWIGSPDWDEFEGMDLPAEQIERTRQWLRTLVRYSEDIAAHIERLNHLCCQIDTPANHGESN